MKKFIALCAYRCLVANTASESIDFQCKYYEADSEQEVHRLIKQESVHSYKNELGDTVEWPLIEVLSVNTAEQFEHGKEICGAIRGAREIANWPKGHVT